MDKIVLKDKTEYEILEGASLDNIKMEVTEFDKIKEVSDKFTTENLSEVEFKVNDDVTGEYKYLILQNISFVQKSVEQTEDDTTTTSYIVTISLRESTEIERRISALEDQASVLAQGHESNVTAIDGIITDIIPVTLGTGA